MSRAAGLVAAMLLAGVSAPLAAQSQGDPVRLDDFAVGAPSDTSLRVDQLTTGAHEPLATAQPPDRAIASNPATAQPVAPLPQLSAAGQSPHQAQLSAAGAAPDESRAAVSTPAESRPQGVVRIGGRDRCDPQLAKDQLEQCERILELRAQEFHAPAPPELSPEQKLLAEQRTREDDAGRPSTSLRLRLATRDDPDADLQSNQELAALYLGKPNAAVTTQRQEPPAAPQEASIAEVLKTLQIATSAPPGTAP
jgi:hypothetical protein